MPDGLSVRRVRTAHVSGPSPALTLAGVSLEYRRRGAGLVAGGPFCVARGYVVSSEFDEEEQESRPKTALYVEDVLIVLAVVALFVLAVFFRRTWWGQAALVGVLIVMGVVFFFRLRRAHRAFTGRGDEL